LDAFCCQDGVASGAIGTVDQLVAALVTPESFSDVPRRKGYESILVGLQAIAPSAIGILVLEVYIEAESPAAGDGLEGVV
jgi:hypothetical protein